MDSRDVIVIGGSAGSTAPLKTLIAGLPAGFPGTVFIVTHVPRHGLRLLGQVLQGQTQLEVSYPQDGDPVLAGRIYVGPPDRHLMVRSGRIVLGGGPKENMARPAIDPLFRSAALEYGPRVVGVILSGLLNDGASGLAAVKQCGGYAIVQDLEEAEAPDMPQAALAAAAVDRAARSSEIAELILAQTREGSAARAHVAPPPGLRLEVEIAAGGYVSTPKTAMIAKPATFVCPDCNGVLSEVEGELPLRYRCQIGHAVTGEVLEAAKHEQMEVALRTAMRVMEERATLVARLLQAARDAGRSHAAQLYADRLGEYRAQAKILRETILDLMNSEPTNAAAAQDFPPHRATKRLPAAFALETSHWRSHRHQSVRPRRRSRPSRLSLESPLRRAVLRPLNGFSPICRAKPVRPMSSRSARRTESIPNVWSSWPDCKAAFRLRSWPMGSI
ncbi:MAG: CheB methylesterase [Phenylobacterium sp.]|nr:CheB methylesterase [Phenylobacterium sp.]